MKTINPWDAQKPIETDSEMKDILMVAKIFIVVAILAVILLKIVGVI